MTSKSILDDVFVASIYGCADRPEGWTGVLEELRLALGAKAVGFVEHGLNLTSAAVGPFVGVPAEVVAQYEDGFCHSNLWMLRGKHLIRPGAVLTSQRMCPDEVVLSTDFYRSFLHPAGLFHHITAVIDADSDRATLLVALREETASAFGDKEVAATTSLLGHVRQAVALQRRISGLAGDRAAAVGALDRIPHGVLVLDDSGHIVLQNRSAQLILESRDGLKLEDGEVAATSQTERYRLHELIAGAADVQHGLGGGIVVHRASAKQPLHVLAIPLRGLVDFAGRQKGGTLLFVSDGRGCPSRAGGLLSRLYGLTPAESRLAVLLIQGASLLDAGTALGIAPNTAHSQLAAIFGKTGTTRQADLIRIVLPGPAPLLFE